MSYLFDPEIGTDTITLRYYQKQALDNTRVEFGRGIRSTAILHGTGTGKSLLLAKMALGAAEKRKRTLVVAHTGELIAQNANAIERCGIVPGVEKAGSYARAAFDPSVVVACSPSLRGKRLASWDRDHFDLLLFDEGHHVVAPTQAAIRDHFRKARVVLFTATPDRADGVRLDDPRVCQTVAHEYDIFDAMTAPAPGPYLVPYHVVRKDIGIDLRDLKPGKGDFDEDEMDRRISEKAKDFANSVRQGAGDLVTLIFTPGVRSATAIATALGSMFGDDRADFVYGEDPHRDYKLARFRGDKEHVGNWSQFLVCCHLCCEGVDIPRIGCVSLMRPTDSRSLAHQMVGRGLRLFPGKTSCLILDYAWLTSQHKPVRPADLFSKQLGTQEALDYADEIIAENPGMSILDVIEKAKVRAKKAERRIIEVEARIRDVPDVRREVYDPFDGNAPAPPLRLPYTARSDGATPAMIRALKRYNVDAAGYSFGHAGRLIGIYRKAEKEGRLIVPGRETT